jgi:hypothetical protein
VSNEVQDNDDRVSRRDPLAVAGTCVVLGVAVYLVINTWIYLDRFDDAGAGDRLRVAATSLTPFAAAVLVLGTVVIRVRALLLTEDAVIDSQFTPVAARSAFIVTALFAVCSAVAALDIATYSSGERGIAIATRWQAVAGYVVATVVAAIGSWLARCSPPRRVMSIDRSGPPDDFDPGDFDPQTFRPYAPD